MLLLDDNEIKISELDNIGYKNISKDKEKFNTIETGYEIGNWNVYGNGDGKGKLDQRFKEIDFIRINRKSENNISNAKFVFGSEIESKSNSIYELNTISESKIRPKDILKLKEDKHDNDNFKSTRTFNYPNFDFYTKNNYNTNYNKDKKEISIRNCFDFENIKDLKELKRINSVRNKDNFKEFDIHKRDEENFENTKIEFFKRFNNLKRNITEKFNTNRNLFLTKSSEKKTFLCKIIIQNPKDIYPIYNLYDNNTDKFLLSAKKFNFFSKDEYLFSVEENNFDKKSENYLGKMCSNLLGNKFQIFDYIKDNKNKDVINSNLTEKNLSQRQNKNIKTNTNRNIGFIEYVNKSINRNLL